MSAPRLVRVVALLSCVTASAIAAQPLPTIVTRTDVRCPVCRHEFQAFAIQQADSAGGVDRDLLPRSIGAQPELYRVSTCTRCGYSGYLTDFDELVAIPPDMRAKILESPRLALPDGVNEKSDPRDIGPEWRYELATRCYRWRRRSDEAMAWLWLRRSWAAREVGAVIPSEGRLRRVMAFIERWLPDAEAVTNQADRELMLATHVAGALADGEFNRYQAPYVRLALALLLRRHGENRQAEPLLEQLSNKTDWPEDLAAAIQSMRDSIDRERRAQRQAIAHFERALAARRVDPKNRATAWYLLGELYRRTGADAEATRCYDHALHDESAPPSMRHWAREQRAWAEFRIEQPAAASNPSQPSG